MGFSIKEVTYKNKYLLYLTDQTLSGPWFSFTLSGEKIGTIPVLLKNIEPTPIYQLINSRKGKAIDRITLDFDIKEYLRKLISEDKIPPIKFREDDNSRIRLYIDVFKKPLVPYMNTFFTFKNNSDFNLNDFKMYLVFDFDINGLEGYDNDYSGYNVEHDIIYQYDHTGLHGGFSTISKISNFESVLAKDFDITEEKLNLSNSLYKGKGEILSATQIEFKTLEPRRTFQTAFVLSGGLDKEEFINNIKEGKMNAMRYLSQVNRSVKSIIRNKQEVGFEKLNKSKSKGCPPQ